MTASKFAAHIASHSQAYAINRKCAKCGSEYPLKNRAAFKSMWHVYWQGWKCSECNRKEKAALELSGQAERERKRERIRGEFDLGKRRPIDITQLNLEDAVWLLSIIRLGASEDLNLVNLYAHSELPLAPTEALKHEIITGLQRKSLLFIHPDSPPEAFDFSEDSWRYYPNKVLWTLPIGPGGQTFEILEKFEHMIRSQDFPAPWEDQLDSLWIKIALHECLQYIDICMRKHNLDAKPGPKTELVLSSLLHDFSVAQMYNFIWRAAKEAAAFYMRDRVTKTHAANTVIGTIQRSADNAKAGGWNVKPFRRDFDCPQPMISRVLFGSFLQIGDGGFTIPLSSRPELSGEGDLDDLENLDESRTN